MRDAESLLERLWADGGPIARTAAEAALGLPPRERLEALADALAGDDLAQLLDGATALYRDGFSPRTVAEQLARVLRDAVVNDATGRDGYRAPVGREALLRTLHQFDDELDRFVRHDDLYALEAALLKAANAAAARPYRPESAPEIAGVAAVPSVDPTAATSPSSGQAAPTAASRPAVPPSEPTRSEPARSLPAFEPNARPGSEPTATPAPPPVASRPASSDDAPSDPPPDAAVDAAPSTSAADAPPVAPSAPRSGRTLSWHQVKTKASAQLKAFLQPAEDEVADGVLTLRYGERHRFHFGQLKARQDELAALVGEVAGPGWSLVIEGPDETIRKKA